MSQFTIFSAKNSDTIGFVINDGYFDRNYFVKKDQLRLSNDSFLLRDDYVQQGYEWNNGKAFLWGIPKTETLVRKFLRQLNITEVTEIPEWVKKTRRDVKKEIGAHEEEVFKQSLLYIFAHLFSKKDNK